MLAQRGASDSIPGFVESAIHYLLDNLEWKSDADLPILRKDGRGYRWKALFLPAGTRLRMRYAGEYHYAEVIDDKIIFQDRPVSPSEFTFAVTKTARNAWRDIEVKRLGDPEWILSDKLR